MVDRNKIIAEMIGAQPSDKRHEGLEQAEQQAHTKNCTPGIAAHYDTANDRYRETVYSKGYCKKYYIKYIHNRCKDNNFIP